MHHELKKEKQSIFTRLLLFNSLEFFSQESLSLSHLGIHLQVSMKGCVWFGFSNSFFYPYLQGVPLHIGLLMALNYDFRD